MTTLDQHRGRAAATDHAPRRTSPVRRVLSSPWTWAAVLIAVSVSWGIRLQRVAPEVFLGAAPLVGRDPKDGWAWRCSWSLAAAAALGALVAYATARRWWWRLRVRWIVPITGVAAAVFAILLAATDGTDGLLYGAVHPTEYLANLDSLPPVGEFVRGFVDDIDAYSVHVRGHPPGFVVLLVAMDTVGLGGGWPVVGLSVLGAALTPAGVLVAVWAQAGAEWVRRVTPLLVVAPYALWMITSADALFTATGAWGVAACALGVRSAGRPASIAWGLLCGTLLGMLLFFTYGGATFVLVPLTVVIVGWRQRRPGIVGTVAGAVVAAGLVTAGWALAGFWWFAGAAETRLQYWAGTAQFRPLAYFALANLAATLIAIGPASYGGLVRLWHERRRPPAVAALILGGLVALGASHLSQYSRAEVERIWLLFFPWLVVAGGLLLHGPAPSDAEDPGRHVRQVAPAWVVVGVQVALAVVLQAALVSKW